MAANSFSLISNSLLLFLRDYVARFRLVGGVFLIDGIVFSRMFFFFFFINGFVDL